MLVSSGGAWVFPEGSLRVRPKEAWQRQTAKAGGKQKITAAKHPGEKV
jgi:hypothetical protein